MNYEKTVLENGLTILTAPVPYVRSVAVGVFLSTGSRHENDSLAGASHFIEHMVFKGTARWPTARDISEAVEGIGGMINASTGRETTMYWIKVAQPHTRLAIEVLADMLIHPLFDPEELDKERSVVIEEISMLHDSPESLVQLLINEVMWGDHPLGREISGTKESMRSMTREAVLEYMAQHYGPKRTVISVAGAIDSAEVLDMVRGVFGEWNGAGASQPALFQSQQGAARARVTNKETEQAHISLALTTIDRNHPDRFILSLANTILGDGMSSRLFQQIRERQALAYSVDSYAGFMQDTGVLEVYAGTDPVRAQRALEAILGELSRIREEPVTADELHRAVEFNRGRLLLQMENTSAVASWWGRQEVLPGRVYTVDEAIEALEQVTIADVQRVMQSAIRQERLNLAVVGPFENADEFMERLQLP